MIIRFKETECDFTNIENEYKYDSFIGGSEMLRVLNSFDDADRRLLILYSELQSTRKVGAYIGVSHTKVNYILRDLRKKFKERLCGC